VAYGWIDPNYTPVEVVQSNKGYVKGKGGKGGQKGAGGRGKGNWQGGKGQNNSSLSPPSYVPTAPPPKPPQ